MRKLIVSVLILIAFLAVLSTISTYLPSLNDFLKTDIASPTTTLKVTNEESVVIDAVKNVGPSVVTVAETLSFGTDPFFRQTVPTGPQNIGTGFVVSDSGLVITNKHVVSDIGAKFQIITNKEKKYDVQKIYRDPLNDIAILQINAVQNSGEKLKPVTLGDSSRLQVGQFVIAIGTALGEFSNTVTTGVVSGLGRGIIAGDRLQGYIEQLDNVIQTDAAINPGNSGGPLLNSQGEVIGVTVAVARSGENIGFALPINLIKDSIKNFNEGGQFNRPYLGVSYKMLNKETALLNDVPQGAYVQSVVLGSPADKAGIEQADIITKIDGQSIEDTKSELSTTISKKKVGDKINITIFRDGKIIDILATLEAAPNQ
ncbi:MAG: trypsin-like peptidase domain-containing protein [Candidatus Levybacteria bacterium]|nr:trypsin-like peptidase domain-containing protein [Candidatus Levybacteria bacterium]